jgi:hypothetical protein
MRSPRGVAASIILLATVPIALAVAIATGGGGEPIVHFGIGAGALMLAAAMFDFGLPRAATWIGAAAAAVWGFTFVLQGVADAVGNEQLHQLAFNVLGQQLERVLPDVMLIWFVALLLFGSEGRTRVLGSILVPIVIVAEIVVYVGPLLGLNPPFIKVALLLPIVWLLFESAKGPASGTEGSQISGGTRPLPASATADVRG